MQRTFHTPILCLSFAMTALTPLMTLQAAGQSSTARTPVLVELFTSEGCSSCPPADALLARLLQQQPVANAEVIVLEEHVDYWDSLGWHDRFSGRQFTDRQTGYTDRMRLDSNYTPQMIVDGTEQFVGNDSTRALRAITQAARTAKPMLMLSPLSIDGSHISGSVSAASPGLAKADLYAALIEPMATTSVLRGENGGRTLHHVSVVRSMRKIGTLDALAHGAVNFSLDAPHDSNAAQLRVVLFAQAAVQGMVVAATVSPVAQTTTSRQQAAR